MLVVDDFRTGVRARVGDFEALELDLAEAGSSERVADFMVQHRVDSVIHFAARKQVAESVAYPLRYLRDNIVGLAAVLNAVTQVGVARFLFSSSAAVYGDVSGVVDEDATCDPVNPYGRSKLAGEWGSPPPLRRFLASMRSVCGISMWRVRGGLILLTKLF